MSNPKQVVLLRRLRAFWGIAHLAVLLLSAIKSQAAAQLFTEYPNIFGTSNPAYSISGVLWGNYENGNIDILLLRQTGVLQFRVGPANQLPSATQITNTPIVKDLTGVPNSGAWADYNNDSQLDVFISKTWSAPDTNTLNALYRGTANNFTNITLQSLGTNLFKGSGCAWADFDRDGWLDLFVASASDSNGVCYLYHNNNGDGTFTRMLAAGSIVTDHWNAYGCAWGDYDNDGWPDLFV
ncbi:MAG TPA: VCBS repeat-containing protein, partial [Verrucomicrobiae bacterium]